MAICVDLWVVLLQPDPEQQTCALRHSDDEIIHAQSSMQVAAFDQGMYHTKLDSSMDCDVSSGTSVF